MNSGRLIGGIIAGSFVGVIAFFIAFSAQGAIFDNQGPVQARVGDTHGVAFLMNAIWLGGVPSLVGGAIAGMIVLRPNGRLRRLVVPAVVGGTGGCIVSILVWTANRQDMQGLNPIMFAGVGVAALLAAVTAAGIAAGSPPSDSGN